MVYREARESQLRVWLDYGLAQDVRITYMGYLVDSGRVLWR